MAAGADYGEVRQVAAAADDQDHRPPPLRVRDVDACCVARWAEQFRDHTLPFAIRKLTDDEVAYLHSDGVFLPAGGGVPPGTYVVEEGGSDTEALDSDSDDDGGGRAGAAAPANRSEVSLPELVAWMERIIDDFGGDVLPKLNWSTPKDAVWISPANSLLCRTPNDVLMLLKSSDHITHDLAHAYDDCVDGTPGQRPSEVYLMLRQWYSVAPALEFRCFVKGGALIGISQRASSNYFPFLLDAQPTITRTILKFFYTVVHRRFPLDAYVMDVALSQSMRRVYLVDFGPFGPSTEPLLFDWSELVAAPVPHVDDDMSQAALDDQALDELACDVDVRLVRNEAGIQPLSSQLNRAPKEMVELSMGHLSFDDVMEQLRAEQARQARELH